MNVMTDIEQVYTFSKKFLKSEAQVTTQKRIPDLVSYNTVLQEYFSFLVEQLQGATGHMPMDGLSGEDYYERMKRYPADTPREIFKISEYNSPEYGKVWVVFVSERNYKETFKHLENAFVVIEEEGKLKVAKFLLYNNYTEIGDPDAPYRWDDMEGYSDLNFETLKNPVKIERYVEPSDSEEGLKLYNDDI
jgi:hypothetical protein